MKKRNFTQAFLGLVSTLMLLMAIGCGGGGSTESVAPTGSSVTPQATPTYKVSGAVKGLIGTGLVIQNNGTDDLLLSKNGTFTFSTPIDDGADCNVTITSQPVDPIQTCQVINGIQTVSGSNITNVELLCFSGDMETFDGEIDAGIWKSSAEYSRELVAGALEYNLAATSNFALNYLTFKDQTCGSVALDFTITGTDFTGTGIPEYSTRLETCGYHTTTAGEGLGRKTGDVFAAIILEGSQSPFQVFYQVFRCLNDDCGNSEDVDFLTPGTSGYVLLGDIAFGTPAKVLIDWNTLSQGEFSFQLNSDPVVTFDPVANGATIDVAQPNAPKKYFGVKLGLSNPDDIASMTATYDNVWVNGSIYDDFNTMSYLNGSLWNQTYGKVSVDNNRLVIENAKGHVGDASVDNSFHSTEITTQEEFIPNGNVVAADIVLDAGTTVIDNGGSPAEAYAVVEMGFWPSANNETDFTDVFLIQAALKQDTSAISAEIRAIGCADSSCITKHTDETKAYTTPIVKGQLYRFKIEHIGNSIINVSLDNLETLSFDLSTIPEFATTDFKQAKLRTLSRGTDLSGEEVFVRAYFDNIRIGDPL
jgi:hypothetical protein